MKYLVELSFTNPSHEHVSLRRRVERVTRLVEAVNENQAILRATSQQRALGFFIKEAKVVKDSEEKTVVAKAKPEKEDDEQKRLTRKMETGRVSPSEVMTKMAKEEKSGTESYPLLKKGEKLKPMKLKMEEGFDTDPKDIAAYLVDRHGKGKVTMDHIEAYERRRDSHRPIEKHEVMKFVKKMSEEVEQVDEAQKKLKPSYWRAEWRMGTQTEVDKNNKKIYDKLAKTDPEKAKAFHDNLMKMRKEELEQIDELKKSTLASYVNKAANQVRAKTGIASSFETQGTRKRDPEDYETYMNLAKDFRQGAKKRLTGIEKATAKLAKEEVELDEADVTKDLRTSMKMMDIRHGVDADKRDKGYKMSSTVRAAQQKFDAQSKGQGKMRPQAGTLAAKKIKEAAEKMVNKARTVKDDKKKLQNAKMKLNQEKGKTNKINMQPSMEVKN